MLANTLVLVENATNHSFDLVSREGMNSVRREVGVASNLASALIIKNTLDMNALTKPNRHLIQLSQNQIDAVSGEIYPVTVHMVITRHKNVTDALIQDMVDELASLVTTDASLTDILLGGN